MTSRMEIPLVKALVLVRVRGRECFAMMHDLCQPALLAIKRGRQALRTCCNECSLVDDYRLETWSIVLQLRLHRV
jgi:hypothetical protein